MVGFSRIFSGNGSRNSDMEDMASVNRQLLVNKIKVEDRKIEKAQDRRKELLAQLGRIDLDFRVGDDVIFRGRRSRLEIVMYAGYSEMYRPDDWHARVTPYKKDGKLQMRSQLVFSPEEELRTPEGDRDGR